MADGVHLSISGMQDVERAFSRLASSVQGDVLENACKVGGEVIRSEAARIVPVRTGNLRSSLTVQTLARSDTEAKVGVGPSRQAPYGIHLEYGTVRMRSQPFMRPSFDTRKRQAVDEMGKSLRRQIVGARG